MFSPAPTARRGADPPECAARRHAAAARRRGAPPQGYERLEFLGDRVLGLVVADLLWRRHRGRAGGRSDPAAAHLVRRDALARVAREIGLDRHLVLSPAEAAAGAARNPSILADVCEAVIAAIYLDARLLARPSLSSSAGGSR